MGIQCDKPWDGNHMVRKTVADRAKLPLIDKALRGMFGKLQARPVPERLVCIVDQLEKSQEAPSKQSGRR